MSYLPRLPAAAQTPVDNGTVIALLLRRVDELRAQLNQTEPGSPDEADLSDRLRKMESKLDEKLLDL
eukprot:m.134616 g.134616  ORF g.134616 m.134616 type:complete len:67 (+) comp20141_c0_seq1:1242-1442(+)